MTTTTLPNHAQQGRNEHNSTTPQPWGDVTRARLDNAMLQTLEMALNHRMELNRHRTTLLRAATDPAVGCCTCCSPT